MSPCPRIQSSAIDAVSTDRGSPVSDALRSTHMMAEYAHHDTMNYVERKRTLKTPRQLALAPPRIPRTVVRVDMMPSARHGPHGREVQASGAALVAMTISSISSPASDPRRRRAAATRDTARHTSGSSSRSRTLS